MNRIELFNPSARYRILDSDYTIYVPYIDLNILYYPSPMLRENTMS
jgi:hypothetical protein